MSNSMKNGSVKREALKKLIRSLHEGAKPEEVKKKFKEQFDDVSAAEIGKIEEELINEGMPREEIHRLCDVHLAIMRESIETEKVLAPAGHPIHILMEEHALLLEFAGQLKSMADALWKESDFSSTSKKMDELKNVVQRFKDSESHYIREENVLFPFLEKHGVTQPPKMMWMEHDGIRMIKKDLYRLSDESASQDFKDFIQQLRETSITLAETLSNHFFKENNILFPMALQVIMDDEWKDIRYQFNELGYCSFTPEEATVSFGEREVKSVETGAGEGLASFKTGSLSLAEISGIFNTLPVDVTFIDDKDTVRYFNESSERIFPRTTAVLGLKVQDCHPQKSLHLVNKILDDFRSGNRSVAEFWITLQGKLIHIQYFPVHDKNGKYIGCLEVTQDITEIKKIEGEKRLL